MEDNPRVCPKAGVAYCDMKIVPSEWSIRMSRAFHDYKCSTCGVEQDCGTPVPYCVKDDPGEWNCVPCERKEQEAVKLDVEIGAMCSDLGVGPEDSLLAHVQIPERLLRSILDLHQAKNL